MPKPNTSRNSVEIAESGFIPGFFFMLKTVLFSYLISTVLLLLLSVFATFQALNDTAIHISVNTITALCVLFCGFLSGRHFSEKGLVFGALCGTIYSGILCIAGTLFSQSPDFGSASLTALAIGIICGSVGGIVGINTRHKKRR